MIEVPDYLIASAMQGPRSNFEIGGGTEHFFLLILYNFKNIGVGHVPPPLPPYSAVPAMTQIVKNKESN